MKKMLCLILVAVINFSILAEELTGTDVMTKVDKRSTGKTQRATIQMLLVNNKNSKREREITYFQKKNGNDTKTLLVFNKPADVKGSALLSWEYKDTGKDDDKWLYLPAMKRSRRISGDSNDDYFMGTDFTYDDLGDRSVNEDNHKLLGQDSVDGYECWKVESYPKKKEIYNKRIIWVRKDINIITKVEFYNETGIIKLLKVSDIKEISGIWIACKLIMENLSKKHKTELYFTNVEFDLELNDNSFTVNSMERGQ